MIKNKHNNKISLTLLFNNVDLIFTKNIENFSEISREDSFKISQKKISRKNMSVKVGR